MPSPFGPMRVIVNPRAGRGGVERAWPAVREILHRDELEYEVVLTEDRGHAVEAAREAVASGIKFVVAMGGDGTIHEVVNGMMDGPSDPDRILGIVPSGTGSDFVRTFGLSQDPTEAATHLGGKTTWGKLDLGRIRYRSADGREAARWFCNIAEGGIGAHVVETAARMPRALGGRAYRVAALKGIASYRPQAAFVTMNGRKARGVPRDTPLEPLKHAGTFTMVVIANGQFFGGGLRVAPRAIPSDAMLDVLVGEGSKWQAVKALQKMPRGEHVPSPELTEYLADHVVLDGPEPIPVEADGEPLGTTPVVVEIVPSALTLKI